MLRRAIYHQARIATTNLRVQPSTSRRSLTTTCTRTWPSKDTQDRHSLKPEPNEYSKSGSDDAAARTERAAFDPNKTTPEEQHDTAGREAGDEANPLNVSPANPEVSQPREPTEGGAEASKDDSDRSRTSGRGSPPKHGS